jgi:hypothetical protein
MADGKMVMVRLIRVWYSDGRKKVKPFFGTDEILARNKSHPYWW